MDTDEKKWVEAAIELCETATRKGVRLLMVRTQDCHNEHDAVVTNAADADIVTALMAYVAEEADDKVE